MKKIAICFGIIGVAVIAAAFILTRPVSAPAPEVKQAVIFDGRNSAFTIDGRSITLVKGIAETPSAPGSASKTITRYFGNEAKGDLNGDGTEDIAFLVSQENTGGTGLFYYVLVALQTPTGYDMSNAMFIGDRIAPQSTDISQNPRELHVNYAERASGEPMTATPSVGKTLTLRISSGGVLGK